MVPQYRPTLRWEREQFELGRSTVIGCDEVGRGAIAGPVAVGVAAITTSVRRMPAGLADSKLLSPDRRERLVPMIRRWCVSAVGLADAAYIDEFGIVAALGLAGSRAVTGLRTLGVDIQSAVVLLDGSFDWLSRALDDPIDVQVRIKADRDCASVSAASVVAKVHRDALMVAAHDDAPHYAWEANKGYGSRAHYSAIAEYGVHGLHRRTWLHERPSLAETAGLEVRAVDEAPAAGALPAP
ncbi:ribonuclease HII [Curtobacterium ammoniigenes]|uniref:ribonuclease HII n=1 Tax=Curtobacterium ammoniigenes TaxID=395387 RepID=UPI00082A8461|nr:ribonuclease HII [Curtobacterium ammoniigenes]